MKKLFGTDGIRGIANIEPMTVEMAVAIGRATAYVSKRHNGNGRIVIGKDTRLSGYMIENALTAGICSMGVDVFLVGPIPTPAIAFITQSMRADAGIVISASHNSYQDNGIKIFTRDGFKLSYGLEEEIEELIHTNAINNIRPTATEVGRAKRIDDAVGRYIVFSKNIFPDDLSLDGRKIVLDCANGATYKVAPIIFSELGADVSAINISPNGMNINDNCGSQHTAGLSAKVKETGAEVGLAFDGDGDRLIVVDENGVELTGDHILAICAQFMCDEGTLVNNKVIITPMSNFGLRVAFKKMCIDYEEADVGDRNVLNLMQQTGASLGGEQSGHIILLDHHTTGDGIVSALMLLAVMCRTEKPLSELAKVFEASPQALINVPVKSKPPIESLKSVLAEEEKARNILGDKGRTLIRYSGTEQLCRVMVEGPTTEVVNKLAATLVRAVKKEIG
jgi:phosphoglucosamine mutase